MEGGPFRSAPPPVLACSRCGVALPVERSNIISTGLYCDACLFLRNLPPMEVAEPAKERGPAGVVFVSVVLLVVTAVAVLAN